MPPTRIAVPSAHSLPRPEGGAEQLRGSHSELVAVHREHLLDRAQHLRPVQPTFAQELAIARRKLAQFHPENRRLLEQARRLQAQHGHSWRRAGERRSG